MVFFCWTNPRGDLQKLRFCIERLGIDVKKIEPLLDSSGIRYGSLVEYVNSVIDLPSIEGVTFLDRLHTVSYSRRFLNSRCEKIKLTYNRIINKNSILVGQCKTILCYKLITDFLRIPILKDKHFCLSNYFKVGKHLDTHSGHLQLKSMCSFEKIGNVQFINPVNMRGTRYRSWLRHYATSRTVACSIPDEVIGFFNWPNPSRRTIALESTQLLTEMSTRNLPGE
jgi:hypothetical protein